MEGAEDVARRVRAEVGATHVAAGCAWARDDGSFGREMGGDALAFFDLASVTKPMTAVALARSGLEPRTSLGALMEEARGTASEDVAVELFLAHRAGLVAHLPLYEPLTRGEAVDRRAALARAADARRDDAKGAPPPEGFAPLYSDLGYLLAGEVLARHLNVRDAGEAIDRLVVRPLGLRGRLGTARELEARGVDLVARAAPTEVVTWRGGAVVGRVHDENAWALGGEGGCGHAGEFGTIDAVLTFGAAVLDADEELSWLVRERPGGTLRAGFDGKSAEGSSAGSRMSMRAYGHLGFTGTSLWIDPDARIVVALLTNRVHPTRENASIRAARPAAHDALFERAASLRAE